MPIVEAARTASDAKQRALAWVAISLPQALLAVLAHRAINLWLPMIPALYTIPAFARLEAHRGS